jgi:hypothetical protein
MIDFDEAMPLELLLCTAADAYPCVMSDYVNADP